ncbi:G0/G1 switch protein 2 [Aulostomus maculatus]
METLDQIIPFTKEMLNQRPGRGMLKIYMLGSTLAMLGVVGGLLETVFLPFAEYESAEDRPVELLMGDKKQVLKMHTTLDDVVEELETAGIEIKAKHLMTARRRSSTIRLHAS